MVGIGACINKLYFHSLLANSLFGIPKVVISSHLDPFSKMHNFVSKSLWQGCSSWGLGFLLGLHYFWEDSILDLDRKYIWFHSLELIFAVFNHSAVARFYHICCITCLAVVSLLALLVILLYHLFIIFTVLAIILAKPFLLKLSYFFVIMCFTFDTN